MLGTFFACQALNASMSLSLILPPRSPVRTFLVSSSLTPDLNPDSPFFSLGASFSTGAGASVGANYSIVGSVVSETGASGATGAGAGASLIAASTLLAASPI